MTDPFKKPHLKSSSSSSSSSSMSMTDECLLPVVSMPDGGPICEAMACCHELDGVPVDESRLATDMTSIDAAAEHNKTTSSGWSRFKASLCYYAWRAVTPGREDFLKHGDGDVLDCEDEWYVRWLTGKALVKLVGVEVDRQMFKASGYDIIDLSAKPVVKESVTDKQLRVLRRFEFDRDRMTMSVIVEDHGPVMGKRMVYTKGSYEAMKRLCDASSVPEDFDDRTKALAGAGHYVLALAKKVYEGPEDVDEVKRDSLEVGLEMVGLLVFENRLKTDTADVIQELKDGAIRPVMITGDNANTAVKIGRECSMTTADKIVLCDVSPDDDNTVVWHDIATQSVENIDLIQDELQSGRTEIAVTGGAFKLLLQSADTADDKQISKMRELMPYTRIFARMKPFQKVEAVQLLMTTGITAMCGDGANDSGALRMAHVGVAISSGSTNPTVVAPFSSPHSSLQTVLTVIREGRGALANSMAGYKLLIVYGEFMTILSLTQQYFAIYMGEPFWFSCDGVTYLLMSWAIMQARPAKKLAPCRPTCKLIGWETFVSVMLQIVLAALTVAIGYVLLYQQDWFLCKEFDSNLIDPGKWWQKGDNYESTLLATLMLYLLVNTAGVFNMGFDYRRYWLRNYWIVCFWLVGLMFITYLVFAGPALMTCLYHFNCGDRSLMAVWSDLGLIGGVGIIDSAPVGCSCNDQVAFSSTCENQYISCDTTKYNQTYHHNIMPTSFHWVIFGVAAVNVVVAYCLEGLFVVGPFRRWLRRRKAKKLQEKEKLKPMTKTSSKADAIQVDG